MPLIHCHFKPVWWLNNPHLQTLYPALLRKPLPLKRRRERLYTPDGDFIDLDWCESDSKVIAILLHGLSGSSNSGYILGLQQALAWQGFTSVAMNFRGCSGEPNRLARSYHSGETEDINFVYQTVRKRHPESALAAVGFSIGGNVLLKWLGEQGGNLSLFAAAAICVPLLLAPCASKLDRGFSRIYRRQLLKELKHYIDYKKHYLDRIGLDEEAEKLRQLGDLSAIRSFWQYDDRVVAPLHGFKDVHDYYERSSSRQYLPGIKVPTLLIHAKDDPFMTSVVLPDASELTPEVTLEIYSGGGHVGFVGEYPSAGLDYWLDKRISAFLLNCKS
ncbi:MAG: hydrolase [Methylomonas sp.]|nr:hydrolase [Methylomonas sp.]